MNVSFEISGAHLVRQAFGHWPSFHDAEIISLELVRDLSAKGAAPTRATLVIHVREYEPRNVGTADYEMAVTKNFLIEFAFWGVREVRIEDFNHQNVINSITIEPQPEEGSQRVVVESIYGFGGEWICSRAEVTDVRQLSA